MIINQGYELRTSKSGKQRVTVVVKSEPVILNVDPKKLGQPIAMAIAHHLREKVKGITATAAVNTLRARASEAKAYAAGKPWAVKRFNGGRTGATPPKDSTTALNHSGRFADSITATASNDGAWRVNVAANRMSPATSNIQRVIQRVSELVPEIANPALLLQNNVLKKAIEKSMDEAIKKASARTTELRIEAAKRLLDLGSQVLDILAG